MKIAPLLCALVAAAPALAVTQADGQLITSMVATAAGRDARLDVLTATDVKKALDVEANKSLAGCDAATGSCLVEIAQAMDARAVLHGNLGDLGGDVVLTLSLFDSQQGSAVGRVVVKDKDVGIVADRVEAAVKELLASVPAAVDGKRARVLVLDLDVVSAAPAPPPPPGLPMLSVAGIVVAAVGAVGVAAGIGSDIVANDASSKLGTTATLASDVPGLVDTRNGAVTFGEVAYVVGGVLIVGGVALAVVPLVMNE